MQGFEKQVNGEMQKVTEYFGESYDATDPGKVLRVIRDFMLLFDKAIFEIKVRVCSHSTQFQKYFMSLFDKAILKSR